MRAKYALMTNALNTQLLFYLSTAILPCVMVLSFTRSPLRLYCDINDSGDTYHYSSIISGRQRQHFAKMLHHRAYAYKLYLSDIGV